MVRAHKKDMRKIQRDVEKQKKAAEMALNDESMAELRVRVRDTTSGKILKGENAPLASELEAWLEANPGYEEVPQDVDSDDSDDETKGEGDEADPDTIKAKLETAMKGKFIVCDVRACGTFLGVRCVITHLHVLAHFL